MKRDKLKIINGSNLWCTLPFPLNFETCIWWISINISNFLFITDLTILSKESICFYICWHTHQKQSKRRHEAFFGEFPRASILFLINLLKAAEVYIQDASVDDAESEKKKDTKMFSLMFLFFLKCTLRCE